MSNTVNPLFMITPNVWWCKAKAASVRTPHARENSMRASLDAVPQRARTE
jgi:hypothetical protein